jgi:uncharacterized tellurite resistance protein B-like protein
MSILKRLLGSASNANETGPVSEVEAVRRIARELEAMEPDRARYVAAFAYLLSRVANADLSVSEEETAKMQRIVQTLGHLPPDQAALVVEIAKGQNRLFGGTENFLVTRELRDLATREQCLELLDCLFAVSAADESISGAEETQIRQIASELGFTHAELVQARSAYNDKREILKGLPGRPGDR